MRLLLAFLAVGAFIAIGGCSGDDHAGHDHDGCGCHSDVKDADGGGDGAKATPPAKAADNAPPMDVTFACAKDG